MLRTAYKFDRATTAAALRRLLTLESVRRKQQTCRVMTPLDFLGRLCALIPPPRHPLLRFYVPVGQAEILATHPAASSKEAVRMDAAGKVGAELPLDVLRKAAGVRGASFVEEGFEMLGDDLVALRSNLSDEVTPARSGSTGAS